MKKVLVWILIVIVVLLVAALVYFIFQNQRLIGKLSSSPSPISQVAASPIDSPTISPKISPSPQITKEQLQENIKASVNSGNFAALASYMTDPVEVILQATECCGPLSPKEAESQMDYINNGKPFNFDQNSLTISNLKAKNAELAGKFIGISQNTEHLIAFGINNQNQITDIRMSVSWKLYNQ